MMPSIMSGSLIRETPPWARMSAGTRSSAITATAPASSAIFACSAVTTSMMTPPLSISAMPRLTPAVPVAVPPTVGGVLSGLVRVSLLVTVRPSAVCGRAGASARPGGGGCLQPTCRGAAVTVGSAVHEAGRRHVVQVDGPQVLGVAGEPEPAHAARERSARGGHDGVVVEPSCQLDPGAARARAPRRAAPPPGRGAAPRGRRRRPSRRAGQPTGPTPPARARRPAAARARCAASSSSSRLAGSRTSDDGELEGRRPTVAAAGSSSRPRATSIRWCIRSSRCAVQVSQSATTTTTRAERARTTSAGVVLTAHPRRPSRRPGARAPTTVSQS